MSVATRQTRTRLSREETRARIVAAATALVRELSYAELSVGVIMERAGLERTIFYRHFDDLADLLMQTGREAIEELYATQVDLSAARDGAEPDAVRAAIEPAVAVYRRHGPLLRALAEGAAADSEVAAGQARIRRRFDDLVARAMSDLLGLGPEPPADVAELARVLNLMNESYLLDAFGREARVSDTTAIDALTEIWVAVIRQRGG
ncbi:MAG: TetR/AcrR family transcriptional regulator [Solirubrobacterales bacterium]